MADDGAIFFLNGNRVGDLGFAADPVTCTNFATRSVQPDSGIRRWPVPGARWG